MRRIGITTTLIALVAGGCAAIEDSGDSSGLGVAEDALTSRLQAETQSWTATSGDSTSASSSTLRLNANASGDSFTFATNVASGTYDVKLRFSQRNAYGNYQVQINGTTAGTISGYSANTRDTWTTISLGTRSLSGNVQFKFVSTGKNSAATDYDAKLDYIELTTSGGSTGSGGTTAAGGATSTGGVRQTGGTTSTSSYACNGTTAGYNATMIKSGSTWVVTSGGTRRYSGGDTVAALQAAYNSLSSGRTSKQSILVQGDGDIPATAQVAMPSYTVLNWCGTVNVSGSASGSDRSPFYARGRTDIQIPNLKMTGAPQYGLFFRGTSNIHLGNIDLRLASSAGIGIRVDTSGSAGTDTNFVTKLRVDSVYGSGMGSHVLETYGVNGITVGKVVGSGVGECGLLLNRSINAEVGEVSCTNCGTGTGYAAFRIANNAGRVGSSYPVGNIHVKKVYARGGGRGIFSVSGSGGLTIDQIDIANTGNNPILLENCTNTTIATQSGTVAGGQIRIAGTTQSNIALKNLALSNGASILQSPCSSTTCTASNITGGNVSLCR